MLLCIILSVVPGLLIWARAFWDYLVSYGALNSMTDGYLNTGRVYDFKAHNSVVTKKTFSFIVLWFLFSIFTIISVIPVFWIIGFVFFIYFIRPMYIASACPLCQGQDSPTVLTPHSRLSPLSLTD